MSTTTDDILERQNRTKTDDQNNDNLSIDEIRRLISMPLFQLMHNAHEVLNNNFKDRAIQISALFNIKSGGCSENCSYCSQSARHKTNITKTKLSDVESVKEAARKAKQCGADRFCIAAAWREVRDNNLEQIAKMIDAVKAEGLESCASLGFLKPHQAEALKEAGLDFYNHNIDCSREYYGKIVTTHTFDERLETIKTAQNAGIKICCGGIIGMGETELDRAKMICELANMKPSPQSVPINTLVPIPGTPMADTPKIDGFDIVRTIAATRIALPKAYIRLSAGRGEMSRELQAMCLFSGANSIFYGDLLLTAPNAKTADDIKLLNDLGIACRALEV